MPRRHGGGPPQSVSITEFLAASDSGLLDEDGEPSDWIEIHNGGDEAVDLSGWHLTDDFGDPAKWELPATSIEAGGYLVVFASGKDRRAAGSELHTNFRLDSGADLNLSDAIALLGFLFLGSGKALPCRDGSLLDGSNWLLLDSNGDGAVDITDAIHVLSFLILGGSQPALGAGCVRIPGCPDVCGP